MRLSTKVRYGVRAMIELAKHGNGERVPLGELAGKQKISNKYLEPIMASLKIAGLVDSAMGKGGGYRLTRPAREITVWDLYSVLDVSSALVECERQSPEEKNICPRLEVCAARETWLGLNDVIANYLKTKNLGSLAHREIRLQSQKTSRGGAKKRKRAHAKKSGEKKLKS